MPIGILAAQLNVYLLTGSVMVIVLDIMFCSSISSGSLPALQTVLSKEDVARFLESF